MSNKFTEYEYVILDSSVFFSELSDAFIENLNEVETIFISPTFKSEVFNILKIASKKVRSNFKSNQEKINKKILKFYQKYGVVDSYQLALLLENKSGSVLLIESNFSLEQKIIFSDKKIVLYSLIDNRLIKSSDFSKERDLLILEKDNDPLEYVGVEVGDTVYTYKKSYYLSEAFERGAEAQIFKVNEDENILAKVYLEDENKKFILSKQKFENIKNLKNINSDSDVPWLSLPLDIVFADKALTKPIGYTMKYFKEVEFLSNNSLFTGGSIEKTLLENKDVTVKDVLEIAINFVRQILLLSLNGIHVSDFNSKNFAIKKTDMSKIIMVDTDSYCCDGYITKCSTYIGMLHYKYKIDDWGRFIQFCDESLFAFVFALFSLDAGYMLVRKSKFKFSDSKLETMTNPNIKAKWDSIPDNMKKLYKDVFEYNKYPSINVLLYELDEVYTKDFVSTKYEEIYKQTLNEIAPDFFEEKESIKEEIPSKKEVPKKEEEKKKSKFVLLKFVAFALVILVAIRYGPGLVQSNDDNALRENKVIEAGVNNSEDNESVAENQKEENDETAITHITADNGVEAGVNNSEDNESVAENQKEENDETAITHITANNGVEAGVNNSEDNESVSKNEFKRYDTDNGYFFSYTGDLEGYCEYYWDTGDIYKGNYKNGLRHSKGLYIWPNGDTYEGDFADDYFHGKGTFNWMDGTSYYGDVVNDERTGKGTFNWADGTSYYGDVVNDERTGKGLFTWPNGDTYEGDFVNGYFHGKGTFNWTNGTSYYGDVVNDERTGKGLFTWPNGDTYEGDFVNGYFHGKGTFNWTDGTSYYGDVVNDERTGEGIFTWPNGNIYKGHFEDGYFSGYGEFSWVNGDYYEGNFIDGARTGKGFYQWSNGNQYEGDFVDGYRTGQGVFTWPNGDVYTGSFVNDYREGKGIYKWTDGSYYEGDFKEGLFSGYGTMYASDGTIINSGRYENDEFIGE